MHETNTFEHKHCTASGGHDVTDSLIAHKPAFRTSWVCVDMCSTQSFGPQYDVTQLLVVTRIRQDVSAGTCVAGMISPPRQHTSCSSMPRILEHPCDSWLSDVPKIQTLAAQPRTAWAVAGLCVSANFVSRWEHGQQGCAPYCTKVCWDRSALTGAKHVRPKASASRSKFHLHVTTPALPVYLSSLPWFSPRKRRFQRKHPLTGMGSSLNVSKHIGMGGTGLVSHFWIRTSE